MVEDLELLGALDDGLGVDVGDGLERDEDGLVLHRDGDLVAPDAAAPDVVLLGRDGVAALLEQVVDRLGDDRAVLALKARVFDDRVVPVPDVAEALQAAHEDAQVALLQLHRALRVRLARGALRLVLAALNPGLLRRRLARGGCAVRAVVRARRQLGGGAARALRGDLGLAALLVDDGTGLGGDDVFPRGHVGLDVLHGELVEELLAAERGARRDRKSVV